MILQRSLTLRITCYFSIATMIVVSVLYFFISFSVERHFVKEGEIYLSKKVHFIENIITKRNLTNEFSNILNDVERHEGLVLKVKQNDKTLYSSSHVDFPERFFDANYLIKGKLLHWESNQSTYNGIKFTINSNSPTVPPLTIILAQNINSNLDFLSSFKRILQEYILLAGIVTAILSWFATKRGLQPLQTLSKQAMQISVNDIDQRMPVENLPNEIAGLSVTLNKMLERLEDAFSQLSNFSSDIAHELRTPINNLMMQNQVSLSQPRTEKEYRNILASNAEEYEHLARMISDMLFLAKVENQLALHSTETISLNKELLNLAEFYDALAEENQITFKVEGEASVEGDKSMLTRAFSNLISNAVRHGDENSVISISMKAIKNNVFIEFHNIGETIDPKDIQHLFKRFYRADKSRTHSTEEHVGLGLAITQSIAKAHGGDIQVKSHENETVFTLKLSRV